MSYVWQYVAQAGWPATTNYLWEGNLAVISVLNRKGGVGKTTVAVHLAAGLARLGQPTVIVDADVSQGDATIWLRGPRFVPGVMGTLDLLSGRPLTSCLQATAVENLLLVPPGQGAESIYQIEPTARRLAEAHARLRADSFCHIVIDCAPGWSGLSLAALCLCDYVLCPVSVDYGGFRGLLDLIRQMDELRSRHGQLLFVVPTKVDYRSRRFTENVLAALKEKVPQALTPPLPVSSQVGQAYARRQLLWQYAPKGRATVAIEQLVRCVDERIREQG